MLWWPTQAPTFRMKAVGFCYRMRRIGQLNAKVLIPGPGRVASMPVVLPMQTVPVIILSGIVFRVPARAADYIRIRESKGPMGMTRCVAVPGRIARLVRPTARLVRPTARLVRPTVRLVRPTVRLVRPTARLVRPTARLVRLTVRLVRPTVRLVRPTARLVRLTVRLVRPTVRLVRPTVRLVRPTVRLVRPTVRLVHPTVRLVHPTVRLVRPTALLVRPTALLVLRQVPLRVQAIQGPLRRDAKGSSYEFDQIVWDIGLRSWGNVMPKFRIACAGSERCLVVRSAGYGCDG
jgi:hypothetical protein